MNTDELGQLPPRSFPGFALQAIPYSLHRGFVVPDLSTANCLHSHIWTSHPRGP
jgi:hypothetical protein